MKKLLFSCIALFAMTATFGQNDEARFVIVDTLTQKFGFMDRNGNVVIEPQYEEVHLLQRGTPFPFVEGMAAVNKNGEWGFIDIKGNMVIKPQFEEVSDFSEQGYAIGLFDDDHMVFFDKTGKTINIAEYLTNLYFDSNFSEDMVLIVDEYDGLALVELNGKYGFIDKTGKFVIEPQFRDASQFFEGLAIIETIDFKQGVIDKSGKIVFGPVDAGINPFKDGLAIVFEKDDVYYIDKTGKRVLNFLR